MKVYGDATPIIRVTADAHAESLEDAVRDAQAGVRRRSGRLASDIEARISSDRLTGGFGSNLPYAGVEERGMDVGPRRGPHMTGSHAIQRAGQRWPDHMADRMRSR